MAKKRFGQNFLQDQTVIDRILRAFNPKPTDTVIEIGPGQGVLTQPLLQILNQLTVVEIDRDLIPALTTLSELGNIQVLHQDVLTLDLNTLNITNAARLIGNLPYNISTPLLFHLLNQAEFIQDMVFMLQKEVADRLLADVGTKAYGRLTVMLRYRCDVDRLFDVPPEAFCPAPKVYSTMVRLKPKIPDVLVQDCVFFAKIVGAAFNQRRKKIRNSLSDFLNESELQRCGIDVNLRPEDLTVADFVNISNHSVK